MDPLLTLNCCSFIVASSCVQCLNVLYLCYLLGNTGNKRTYKEALSDQVNMWVSEPKSSAHHTTILNSRHMITITVSNKNLVDCVTTQRKIFKHIICHFYILGLTQEQSFTVLQNVVQYLEMRQGSNLFNI